MRNMHKLVYNMQFLVGQAFVAAGQVDDAAVAEAIL